MLGILEYLTRLPKQYYYIVVVIGIVIIAAIWYQVTTSERFLRIIISLFPKNHEAHFNLGNLLSKTNGRQAEAERELRQAITLNPKFRDSYYALATILWEKANWDGEIEILCTKMFALFPDDPMAFLILGYWHEKRNSLPEAEKAYLEAIAFAPRFVMAYDYLVNLLMRQQRFIEAHQIYLQAKNILPHNTEKYYILTAYALHSNGEYSKAAVAYKKAIRQNSNNGNAYLNLGLLQQNELHQPDDAEQAYRRLIQLRPKNPDGYFQLGMLLHEHYHRYEEAEAMFQKTVELNPQDGTALYNIACIKAIMKDSESAFNYLREAIQKGFDKVWAWDDPEIECLHDDPRFIEIVGLQQIKE